MSLEEYENSFRTPGDIENYIRSEISKKSDDKGLPKEWGDKKQPIIQSEQKEINNHCSECGVEIYPGSKFCIKCGSKLSMKEIIKEKAKENIPNFEDKVSYLKYQERVKTLKRITESYRKSYPEAFESVNNAATNAGFDNLFVTAAARTDVVTGRLRNSIYVEPRNFKNTVFFPTEALYNHKIFEEVDKDFTDLGSKIVMFHEKQHYNGIARQLAQRGVLIETEEQYKDYISALSEEIGKPKEEIKKKVEELTDEKEIFIESQTGIQMIKENPQEFETKDDVINKIAACSVYLDAIYEGVDALKKESTKDENDFVKKFYNEHYVSLKSDIIDKIIDTENRIKKNLLDKYNKKYNISNETKYIQKE